MPRQPKFGRLGSSSGAPFGPVGFNHPGRTERAANDRSRPFDSHALRR